MKQSIASLKERLTGLHSLDIVSYEVGACLGFWRDFGAPTGEDPWNGTKGVIGSNNPLGKAIDSFILGMVDENMLEYRENEEITEFRWNPKYEGLV